MHSEDPSPSPIHGRPIRSPEPGDSVLQALIREQQVNGGIAESVMASIARRYGTSIGEVRGVVHFYSFLDDAPGAVFDIRVSDNIVDRMAGSAQTLAALQASLGLTPDDPRQAGPVRLRRTSCIGLPDQGPGVLVNGFSVPRVDPEKARRIAAHARAGEPLDRWPAEWFAVDDNVRVAGPILEDPLPAGAALERLRGLGAERFLDELERSGLRGRGGAGFPTARKWRFCAGTPAEKRVVVCNADEGEPGTFKDRVLLTRHADRLIEGMALCGAAIGADIGLIYLRGEYRHLLAHLESEISRARETNRLPDDFELHIHLGAGAYICGEESALIESLEGRRGVPRIRPPFPVTSGFTGLPTVVNNVETFIAAAMVAAHGPDWLLAHGTVQSSGTRLLSISGDCGEPGIYEIPHGTRVDDVLDLCGAASSQAVQIGGPAGALVPPSRFEHGIAYEDYPTGGSFMVFDESRDLVEVVRNFTDFFIHESCGFCTPCRVGGALLGKQLGKVAGGRGARADLDAMLSFARVMHSASHCGLGQTAANPVVDLMRHFPEKLTARLRGTGFEPAFDLDAELDEARRLTGRDDAAAHIKGETP